ncbi:MAG: hypothetical protein AB9888_17945 [Bacteroidales bacterium]
MKKTISLLSTLIMACMTIQAQEPDSTGSKYLNSAEMMLSDNTGLNIGGYGEVHFNKPFARDQKDLSALDVHRLVMFLGYNFSSKTQFVSEIEFEYAKELWVEQAFLQHRINRHVNFRAGLMLVPMGIINEYHEPNTFNGVERPVIDNRISLSTWREVGLGFSGNILPITMKYQLYAVGGLNGYDTKGIFTGSSGLREGRQKGSKAYASSPALTGKVEYYGIKNLNIGLSGYFGKSQSKLYSKLPKDNEALTARADSSVVGISMIGADARYRLSGLELRGQVYYTSITNTEQYNDFTGTVTGNNDLGKSMLGYYAEAGYNVFRPFSGVDQELIPFVRYEFYDMHNSVEGDTDKNLNYQNTIITAGLTFKLNQKSVIKTDVQFTKPASSDMYNKVFNAGIGVMF